MSNQRKYRQPEEKLNLIKRHLVDKESVASICEQQGIAPSQFYQWQQELFAHGAQCFDVGKKRRGKSADKKTIERLERQLSERDRKLSKKNEVIAELLEDHTLLKKSFGET